MSRRKLTAEATRALYEAYLCYFARLCFESLHPSAPLDENFHIDVVCKALVDLLNAPSGTAALNLPPRHLKSFLASVAFPLYALHKQRSLGILILAGNQELATELLGSAIKILNSERYRSIFGDVSYRRQGSKLTFSTGGSIQFSTYGHNIIGKGFDLCIIDDPQSPTTVQNPKLREGANAFFDSSVRQRMNRSSEGRVLIVQQRLHDDDLTGHLVEKQPVTVTAMPAIALRDEVWETERGKVTRARGEALCPARENWHQWRSRLTEIGGVEFMAQCEQMPLAGQQAVEVQGYCYYFTPVDEQGQPGKVRSIFGRQSVATFVDQRVFGVNHGISLINPEPQTLSEWEKAAVAHQSALIRSSVRAH